MLANLTLKADIWGGYRRICPKTSQKCFWFEIKGIFKETLNFDRGELKGKGKFIECHRVQNGSGVTQPPIQWVPGALSLEVKRPGRESDHSHPCTAYVKKCMELYLHSPCTPSWHVHCIYSSYLWNKKYVQNFLKESCRKADD